MSNLQDITNLHSHTIHLGLVGRSESAPAILTQAAQKEDEVINSKKVPSKRGQSDTDTYTIKNSNNSKSKPKLPRFFTSFNQNITKSWESSYEAIGH
ncbi:uncharacterized protein L201_003312 [Kwoniella dendrophila CBS 6074]|uniref:Uncharacterized protein n=1 Tax=Kwoniella dendrophila CBS 6074 TaxID=1295534 RepID=A0AAX4JT94_9TREE